MHLSAHSVNAFICVLVARTAGSLGASKEQYLDILHTPPSRPADAQGPGDVVESDGPVAQVAHYILAKAHAIQINANSPPLCSQVKWVIQASTDIPDVLLEWLEAHPNVELQRSWHT